VQLKYQAGSAVDSGLEYTTTKLPYLSQSSDWAAPLISERGRARPLLCDDGHAVSASILGYVFLESRRRRISYFLLASLCITMHYGIAQAASEPYRPLQDVNVNSHSVWDIQTTDIMYGATMALLDPNPSFQEIKVISRAAWSCDMCLKPRR
jgi:hypothetical protein